LSPLSIARRVLWSAAAALFGILLFSLAANDRVPALVSAFFPALAVVSIWRPAAGLTAGAVLVPVATWIGRTWDESLAWPEAVAVAFLLGYAVHQARQTPSKQADALTVAIHATIAIVVASFGVQLFVLHGTIGGEALAGLLRGLGHGSYLVGNGGIAGLDAAMRLIEGLLLAHAGASVARLDRATARVMAAVVIGATAAAALNLWRVWLAALRADTPAVAFLHSLGTLRYNTHYGDVNAAGSYFLMALLPVVGMIRSRWWLWSIPAALIAMSLVLSGSRGALVAGMVTIAAMALLVRTGRRRRPPMRVRSRILAALVVVAVCVVVSFLALQRNLTPASIALRVRAEYARISFEMLGTRPVFGIGIGQYPAQLGEFMTPTLRALYPVPHENAHNNFLQVLAELGVTGLGAFGLVVGIGTARMVRLLKAEESTLVERGAVAGVIAFVLTWFAGHPLLVDAPAFSYWLLFGALAGSAAALGTGRDGEDQLRMSLEERPGWMRWAAAALVVTLAASVPIRAQREIGEANLEHLGIGVSQWHPGKDGIEYRLAGASSVVFVPSYAVVIEVPLRSALETTGLRVEVYLDGRPADVVTVPNHSWHTFVLQVPQPGQGRRFRALELRVLDRSPDLETDLLMIGKVRPRGTQDH